MAAASSLPPQVLSKEELDAVHEMSELLHTGLERDQLVILAQLCDQGLNPVALAHVVRELRKERDAASTARSLDALQRPAAPPKF
ncbi:mitotic-spindle organizing protein 1 [Pelagophyceae sp. CCMP2097]|nr:mitotic-spindle organizing protein 1 [Pelagophyceae sp. CCMP2097]